MNILARQLDGTIQREAGPGAGFALTFPRTALPVGSAQNPIRGQETRPTRHQQIGTHRLAERVTRRRKFLSALPARNLQELVQSAREALSVHCKRDMDNTQQQFNDAYRASLAPELRELMDMPDDGTEPATRRQSAARRRSRAKGLHRRRAHHGVGLGPVPGHAASPAIRLHLGSVGAAAARSRWRPGLPGFGTLAPYDPLHPPAGSIRVSLNIADYPPFDPPAAAAPQTSASDDPVGLQSVGSLYLSRGRRDVSGRRQVHRRPRHLRQARRLHAVRPHQLLGKSRLNPLARNCSDTAALKWPVCGTNGLPPA